MPTAHRKDNQGIPRKPERLLAQSLAELQNVVGGTVRFATFLFLAVSLSGPNAQNVSVATRSADLVYVGGTLPKLHANFYYQLSPVAFSQGIANLQNQISTLSDQEFYAQVAALVALAGDPHTYLYLQPSNTVKAGHKALPLTFKALDDGIFVTGASAAYSQALGTQLVGVGTTNIAGVLQALGTVIPHTNSYWLAKQAETYLTAQQVLQGLDLAPIATSTNLTFQTRAGTQFTLAVSPGTDAIVSFPATSQGTQPEYLQNAGMNYWSTYDSARQLLYFKYNVCEDIPGNPLETTFTSQLLSAFDANPVNTFVIDFRGNGGGNANLIANLGQGLLARFTAFAKNPNLRVYLVQDNGTFSSGIDDVEVFLQGLPAGVSAPGFDPTKIIMSIGAPTGGPTGGYGEVQNFTLPSGLFSGQYSTAYIATPSWITAGPSLLPEISVPNESTDYFSRHDPVLAAILARSGNPPAAPSGGAITVNGAGFRPEEGVAPGSFASIFGTFPASVDEVVFGTSDAKLVYIGTSQINAVVPSPLAAGATPVAVKAKGTTVASGTLTITAAGPGIFVAQSSDVTQPGAILNQDSTVNTSTNRTGQGTVMQIYATGYGALDSNNQAAVQVYIAEQPAAIQYSGPAPGYPGLWQVNAVLPKGVTGQVPVYLSAGNIASNAVTIWVQ